MSYLDCPCKQEKCECCIQVVDACVEFEDVLVLDEVSFSVGRGVLTGVLGPNGGGKSTLFNALVGIQSIAHGKILINGVTPDNLNGLVSYVPQRELVNWRFPLSVKDVVSLGSIKKKSFLSNFDFSVSKDIEEALRKVDMWSSRDILVSDLSGGQRQRAFIARALIQKAEIILLDEAFSGVDVGSQEGLITVLRGLRDEGKTILVATHDLHSLRDRFDNVLCINRHICAQGSPDEVLTQEVLVELYGSHGNMFASHQIGSHDHDG